MKKKVLILTALLSGAMLFAGCNSDSSIKVQKVELSDSEPKIFVEAIENLNEDFITGCDVSSLIAQEESGVIYYNEDGEEQDLLLTLAENGVNTIRIRVWNDPFDSEGNSYGGGGNDVATAIEIGKRATKYGMGVLIDFHYSDFWADPAKQMVPKAWEDMTLEEKQTALYDFTYDSLCEIMDAGVNVTMVQVGNETTTGMSGETKFSAVSKLMVQGCNAVRAVSEKYKADILTAVHFTNPENYDQYLSFAQTMNKFDVDYDVFASSYYPYWHGSTDNLTAVLSEISEKYDKKVMVVEVSYVYTMEDGDGSGNSISESSIAELPYAVTVQGQADCIRDVAAAVAAVGEKGIGVCYWEPAWIPVPGDSAESRSELWEKYGSGWASSYASDYDPEDAGVYYGGSSWDNQALFDFEGHPLASLAVFRYLATGCETDVAIDSFESPEIRIRLDAKITLPETITAYFNNGETESAEVTWEELDFDSTTLGTHTVTGTVNFNDTDYEARCTVKIVELNYVENYSFEDEDDSMWTLNNIDDVTTELFIIDKKSDAVSGTKSLHFYSTSADGVNFSVEQELSNIPEGTYKFSIVMHGGDAYEQDIEIYAIADGKTYTAPVTITGWSEYQTPVITGIVSTTGTITVGARVTTNTGSWGNLDDFLLAPVTE